MTISLTKTPINNVVFGADILRAAALFASTEEARYYLRGVALQIANGRGHVVSTDGHRMIVATFKTNYTGAADIIIPAEAIKRAFTGWKKKDALVFLEGRGRDWKVADVAFSPIDGTFPDWRRVVPGDVVGEGPLGTAAHFDPAYVGDFGKAGKILADEPVIHQRGNEPALVTFGGRRDVFGILMPKRAHELNGEDLAALVAEVSRAAPDAADSAAA